MFTYEDKILQKVVKQLDGLTKLEAYDILHKVEALLVNFNTPIQFKNIKTSIESSYQKGNIIGVDNYGYCYLEDRCHYINIYKITSIFPEFLVGENLYFTVPGQYELVAFDNRNLEETFCNMHLTTVIHQFLKNNHAKKRNPRTKRLLLLELLDKIDPE